MEYNLYTGGFALIDTESVDEVVRITRIATDMVRAAYEQGLTPDEVDALMCSDEWADAIRHRLADG